MTDRPRLYPGHQHQWADAPAQRFPDELDQISWGRDPSNLVVCTVCGFPAPRNVAGLDGQMTGARARVAVFPQIENGTAYTAAELDAALTADEDAQPEQETR